MNYQLSLRGACDVAILLVEQIATVACGSLAMTTLLIIIYAEIHYLCGVHE